MPTDDKEFSAMNTELVKLRSAFAEKEIERSEVAKKLTAIDDDMVFLKEQQRKLLNKIEKYKAQLTSTSFDQDQRSEDITRLRNNLPSLLALIEEQDEVKRVKELSKNTTKE